MSLTKDADADAEQADADLSDVRANESVGRIECTVECSPAAMSMFDPRDVAEMCNEYSQILTRILNGLHGGIDLAKLCIIPKRTIWVVHVTALILDYGGNILDTLVAAARGALFNTRLPKTVVAETDGNYDFEISEDETEPLAGRENIPTAVTVSRIGDGCVIDTTPTEDLCASARVTVFVNRKGHVCGLQKGGKGSLEPSVLIEMIETGVRIGTKNLSALDKVLEEDERDRAQNAVEPVGFR